MTDAGNLTFVATTDKDGVYYSFNVHVLLATKIIRAVDDLDVVKVTQTNIDNNTSIYGYYVLGNDINVKWMKPMMASLKYNKTVQNWEAKFGFRGTFDGLGHTISGFAVNEGGMFGHVGKGAVIKNVKFDKFKYNGQYNGGLFGGTVRGAEITDVTLTNVEYKMPTKDHESVGFFAGRFMQDNKLTNVKIDASNCDVYSVFGRNISNNAYANVEVKVKSFTMLGYNGDVMSDETMLRKLDGVIVYTNETVALAHETILLETTATQIDLSFATEYIGDTVSLTHNGKVLGDGAVLDGKLNVDLSGITETGALTLLASTVKNNVIYTFNVNVLLATKIIRKAEDLDVLKIKTINASIYGYYVLGADIDVQNAKLSQNLSGQPGYWEGGFGFRGIFDGRNHTISNFTAGANGLFGNIGKGAIIKDVNFINVSCNNDYLSAVLARTIIGAEINNVTIGVIGFAGTTCDNGLLASRYTDGVIMEDVKIDASECTVYSLFGNQVGDKADNTYRRVEIKVKSYTMFANQGKDVNSSDKTIAPAGVNVVVA